MESARLKPCDSTPSTSAPSSVAATPMSSASRGRRLSVSSDSSWGGSAMLSDGCCHPLSSRGRRFSISSTSTWEGSAAPGDSCFHPVSSRGREEASVRCSSWASTCSLSSSTCSSPRPDIDADEAQDVSPSELPCPLVVERLSHSPNLRDAVARSANNPRRSSSVPCREPAAERRNSKGSPASLTNNVPATNSSTSGVDLAFVKVSKCLKQARPTADMRSSCTATVSQRRRSSSVSSVRGQRNEAPKHQVQTPMSTDGRTTPVRTGLQRRRSNSIANVRSQNIERSNRQAQATSPGDVRTSSASTGLQRRHSNPKISLDNQNVEVLKRQSIVSSSGDDWASPASTGVPRRRSSSCASVRNQTNDNCNSMVSTTYRRASLAVANSRSPKEPFLAPARAKEDVKRKSWRVGAPTPKARVGFDGEKVDVEREMHKVKEQRASARKAARVAADRASCRRPIESWPGFVDCPEPEPTQPSLPPAPLKLRLEPNVSQLIPSVPTMEDRAWMALMADAAGYLTNAAMEPDQALGEHQSTAPSRRGINFGICENGADSACSCKTESRLADRAACR